MAKGAAKSEHGDTVTASGELLDRGRAGDSRALSSLFRRQGSALRRWAHGRLPPWARRFADTADIVQDALLQTFRRIDTFQNRGKGALQAYLRQAVVHRIQNEMRHVARRPVTDLPDERVEFPAAGETPLEFVMRTEQERKYKRGLEKLAEEEQMLVVGRLELNYTYDQLALITGRATPDAARMAVRRAMLKLAEAMSCD
jgi:RNA polymerase sigma factor (sigma-70 family)